MATAAIAHVNNVFLIFLFKFLSPWNGCEWWVRMFSRKDRSHR